MTLAAVTLDDKYALERGRVFLTGTQALVRLPMMQRQRGAAAGLNTACFVSGYRGSPLGGLDRELWRAKPFVGTVSFKGLTETILEIAMDIPVVAAVNDISNEGVSAKTGVSWVDMGARSGEFLARLHPKGTEPVKVAWFPGPRGAGWVPFVEEGFNNAIADSAVEAVVTKWGDTGKEIQITLIEEALEERPDIDYIVGSAVTAEAAVSILRARGLTGQIKVIADYFTHPVYRGIKRGRFLAAPTDFPVLQGRLAIDQAIRILEGKLTVPHAGPAIEMVTPENVDVIGPEQSLAPASFSPTFTVE